MNKQPGSTLSTSTNGSRSCYVTVKRFTFLSVETILARTIDISNNILIWFWSLFKNVHPLTKRQEKGVCLFFKKEYCSPDTQTHIADIDNRFCQEIQKFFVQAKFTQTLCIWALHVSNKNNSVIVIPQSAANVLHIVIVLKNVTLVSNRDSILVKMFDFSVTQVDNFCKNELITVMFKLFDGENASLVLFKPKRYLNLSVQMLSYILVTMSEQFVFCFGKSNLKFWFG